jgi:hypothetical protein
VSESILFIKDTVDYGIIVFFIQSRITDEDFCRQTKIRSAFFNNEAGMDQINIKGTQILKSTGPEKQRTTGIKLAN